MIAGGVRGARDPRAMPRLVVTQEGARLSAADFDWILFGASALLIGMGFVVLRSATTALGDPGAYLRTRAMHLALAAAAMVVALLVDYRRLARPWRVLYLLNLALLLAVMAVGISRLGAQRWIPLGPLGGFQPSELAKVLLIVTLAGHLSARRPPETLAGVVPYLLHAAVPMLLIVRQPDLGTAMVLGGILVGMLFMAGVRLRLLGGLAGLFLMAAPFVWSVLHDYQRRRLVVFLDPTVDPLGAGYAITQAKIAVGSGLLWGKGLFAGTQNLLRFIPEQHTDFIFTVVGEELGFVGGLLVLALFLVWIWRALRAAALAPDRLGRLIAAGCASMVVFHVFVNVGMTIGLMPITGIPLPFLSYGGSSLLTMGVATGLLLNIGLRRRKILL